MKSYSNNIGSNSRKYTTTQFLQFSGCRPILRSYFQRRLHLSQQENAEGYLWNTPKGFPDAGAIWGNSWNPGESASDEITLKYQTNEFWGLQFSVGTINSRNLPIQTNGTTCMSL